MGEPLTFQVGDTESLELDDGAFDAVIMHTLLSHVSDPLAVLAEAKRVTRPGGMIGVFDGDYASITFEQDDPAKSKADEETIVSAVVTQPRVMRQVPRLAKRADMVLVNPSPISWRRSAKPTSGCRPSSRSGSCFRRQVR